MLIVLAGSIGRSVTGGQAWANLQYLLGLRALEHEVYYLEDSGQWSIVYDWEAGQPTWDADYPAGYIRDVLQCHGWGERWAYRTADESRGLSIAAVRELCAAADLLLIRGIPFLQWRPEYDLPKRRAFIDIDPGFTQIRLANNEPAFAETIAKCEDLFTFAQRIDRPDCKIPRVNRRWLPTLPPVFLDGWPFVSPGATANFTTIARWRGMKDVHYEGVVYGQRDREFPKFLELPRRTGQPFLLALTGGGESECQQHGWEIVPGWMASKSPDDYRRFVQQSRAEFGVAKHCYVETRGGWFSDRSVCYLASGRPVVVQDTGLSDWLPTGAGVLAYRTLQDAVAQVQAVNSDYESHHMAARKIAQEYFDSAGVLQRLLQMCGG
jgi:hypothetical protein